MVKRTIIGKSEGERLVDLLKEARTAAASGSTRPAGNKVLEDDEDFYWTRPDGAESSARQIEQDLDAAQARIDEAEDSLAASQVRLEAAEAEVEAVRDDLTTVETVTLPSAVAALEAADAAAAEELGQLDGKLATAQADLAQAETDLTQLSSDLAAAEGDRAQAAQQVANDMATLDSALATAQADLEAAEGEINSLHADLSAEIVARETAVQDVAADLGTLDGKLSTAFPSGAFDVQAELAQTIRSSTIQYAVGSSETTAPTSGWSATSPTRTPGSFIWFRTVITYADNTTSTSAAALLTGNAGEPGPAGADGTGVTIKGSFDTAAELPATGSDGDAYLVAGDLYVWDSTVSGWENVGRIQGPEGPAGDDGPPGDPGAPGVSVSSITPYYRRLAKGSSAPAKPTTMTPSGWSSMEPDWLPETELYRVDRVVYSSGQFAYTAVTKVAVFAGIDAAMTMANGKNKSTYADFPASSKPGPTPAIDSSRAPGDVHRNRNQSTGEVWAEWQWTGNAWQQVQFGNEVLTSLDVGKLTAGTANIQTGVIDQLWVDGLVAKAAAFNQISVGAGNLVTDPGGHDPQLRTQMGGASWSWNDAGKYWRRDAVPDATTQFNAYLNSTSGYDANHLEAGAMYVIRYEVWVDAVGDDTAARTAIYYRRQDGTTAFVGDGSEPDGDEDTWEPVAPGEWNEVTRYWRAPDDVATGGFAPQLLFGATDSTEVRIRNPFVGKQAAAVLIEDGAINAQKVNAESVAGAVGRFLELTTDQIVAGSATIDSAVITKLFTEIFAAKKITASELSIGAVDSSGDLASGAVGTVQISNGAVNADKVNAESVAGAVGTFLELTTDQVIAGSASIDSAVINKIWADGIAAKALTTSRLTVSPSNMLAGVQAWGLESIDPATDAWRNFGRNAGDPSRWTQGPVTHIVFQPIEFVAGQKYRMSMDVKGSISGTRFYVQLSNGDENGTELAGSISTSQSSTGYIFSGEMVSGTDWNTFTSEFTPVTSGIGVIKIYTNHTSGTSTSSTYQWFRNPVLRPMTSAVLIENGAITTPKLTVTSDMSAAIVNAMTVNTKKLVVTEEAVLQHATLIGQTVVDDINVNGKIIGTDGVFTGTVDFANVNVTGSLLAAEMTGETITGVTVTGSTLRTAIVDGNYAELNSNVRWNRPGLAFRLSGFSEPATLTVRAPSEDSAGGALTGSITMSSAYASGSTAGLGHVSAAPGRAWLQGSGYYIQAGPTRALMQSAQSASVNDGNLAFVEVRSHEALLGFRTDYNAGLGGIRQRILTADAESVKLKAWTNDTSGAVGHYRQYDMFGLFEPQWVNLTPPSGYAAAGHGAPPQYARVGNRVHLRGRIQRTSGTFNVGSTYTVLDFTASWTPQYTERHLIAHGNASGVSRVEISSGDGTVVVSPITGNADWIDFAGVFFDLPITT